MHAAAAIAWSLLSAQTPDKPGLLRSAFWLWLTLAALGLVLILCAWALASALTRRARARRARHARPMIRDAWAEAGRRAAPLDQAEFELDQDIGGPDSERTEGEDGEPPR